MCCDLTRCRRVTAPAAAHLSLFAGAAQRSHVRLALRRVARHQPAATNDNHTHEHGVSRKRQSQWRGDPVVAALRALLCCRSPSLQSRRDSLTGGAVARAVDGWSEKGDASTTSCGWNRRGHFRLPTLMPMPLPLLCPVTGPVGARCPKLQPSPHQQRASPHAPTTDPAVRWMVLRQLWLRRTRARRTVFCSFFLFFCPTFSSPHPPPASSSIRMHSMLPHQGFVWNDAVALVSLSVAQLHCST